MAQERKQHQRKVRRQRVGQNGQLLLQYPLGWGGKRPGAGRKPKQGRAGTPHLRRPGEDSVRRWPLHAVLSVGRELPSLRTRRCMTALRRAFGGGNLRFGLRLTHFSVQRNHIHLIVEADDRRALLQGMRGLTIRVARQLNRALQRKGRVMADRYHLELLDSFARIRRCLAYVLNNQRRHCYQHGGWLKPADYVDPCSSGQAFDGWRRPGHRPPGLDPAGPDPGGLGPPVVQPRGYALRHGWRRHGLIPLDEIPGRRTPAC